MPESMTVTRFWSKVDKTAECWIWTGCEDGSGYGNTGYQGKSIRAHRLAWLWAKGDLPEHPLCLLHRCDNRRCVNPDHLFVGTRAENNRDRHAKQRDKKGPQRRPSTPSLTPLQVDAILVLLQSGEFSGEELCRLFGVTAATVSRIRHGARRRQDRRTGDYVA